METLSLENICKTIGGHVVLDHVNLQLQPGKIYGIIGEKRKRQDDVAAFIGWSDSSKRRKHALRRQDRQEIY